ncbi:hypothetical protein [Sinomonas sp. P47F7]|uniref:hypothetical protein n=1 Tax=Sinomonas sp. P47F7 TaxID=3410987 RepID=UPI003BF57F5D
MPARGLARSTSTRRGLRPELDDAAVDEEYDDDEPRLMIVRGYGPRWAEPPTLPGAERAAAHTGGKR